MKIRILPRILPIISMLLIACNPQVELTGTPFHKGQTVSLSASIGHSTATTNAQLTDKQRISGQDAKQNIRLIWNQGDQIRVIVNQQSAIFTLSAGANTPTATFHGQMPADGSTFRVEYPINYTDHCLTHQTYTPNGFSQGLMRMTTETDGTIDQGFTLTAKNAVLGLQLTGNHTISRITLTNPDNAATYTLHCPAVQLHENQPTLFYIVIPPGKWNKGFRADIYAADQSLITTLTTANTITFSTHEATIMAPRSLGLLFHINGLSLNMIYVEGGTFTMGATPEQEPYADDNERPAHQVTLSSYYIAQTELTQALWTSLMGTTLQQHFEQHGSPESPLAGEGPQHPMYKINKDDCQAFMNELNRLTGKHFRLPTEAEWEYAARGGIYSHSYIYPGGDNLMELAWYKENSNNLVHPVAQKMPNELGLYDMAGNVWEWVSDYYEPYPSTLQTNPTGSTNSTQSIIRGGSRANTYGADNCRVSARYADAIVRPKHRNFIGLRMVLPIE